MNKIKLLYDVARTMRNKEKVEGVLTAQVRKDSEEVFSLRNEFGKNSSGEAKAKVSCELNVEGSRIKRKSLTEFSTPGDCHQRGGLLGRLFHHHGRQECCGIKGCFSRLTLALGILSSLNVEENKNGNGGNVASLNVGDLPEEVRTLLLEKIKRKRASHPHCGILAESDTFESLDGAVVLLVNKGGEINKIVVDLAGRIQDAVGELHNLSANVEVSFAW